MDNPAGYLDRTAVNTRRSVARRLRFAAQRALLLRPPDVIAESDDRDQIRRALATLPASQGEAIVLVGWLGRGAALVFLWQTYEAIAKALGWDDWLKEVVPIFNGAGPLMLEATRRRNALM